MNDLPTAIAADLAIVGLFFATRSCENATAPEPGQTKMADVHSAAFPDNNKRDIPQDHPGIALAAHVTLLFVDQMSRDKSAWRTQKRTDDPILCPVRCAASLIERMCHPVPEFSGLTTINAHACKASKGLVTLQLVSGFLRN